MSLLLRDRLRIALCPDRVILLRRKGLLRARVAEKAILDLDTAGDAANAWQTGIEALRRHLRTNSAGGSCVSVVLSSHFCQYALVEKNVLIKGEDELIAYARHRLRTVYGDVADHWVLRVSDAGKADAYLVCAMESELLQQIAAICQTGNLRLDSVQPYFSIVFNRHRGLLDAATAWLIVHEAGRLLIGLFVEGEWRAISNRRAGANWQLELPAVVSREKQLLGLAEREFNQIWVHAPGIRAIDLQAGEYAARVLETQGLADLELSDRVRYAMAA